MDYFVISVSEDGDMSITKHTKEGLERNLDAVFREEREELVEILKVLGLKARA